MLKNVKFFRDIYISPLKYSSSFGECFFHVFTGGVYVHKVSHQLMKMANKSQPVV